jgi:4-hydroxy-tetrahydrodipicolinate synthase
MNQINSSVSLHNCSLWTALVTPFDEQGNIIIDDLRHVATAQAEAGNGIVLLGSTGEGLALTLAEKKLIVETVCQMNLSVPLMVAVGGFNLSEQIQWVQYCNTQPIDGYLLGTPLYAKPGPVGQTQWFSALLDAAAFPCMLYNVPSRSCVEIPVQTMAQLQHHKNCWAMKEASGDINKFLAYRKACPSVAMFSGEDGLLPYLVPAGAKGLVSVCSNAWPEATNLYVKKALVGETKDLFPVWQTAISSLFEVANPIPVKVLMNAQQEILTPVLRAPLTHLELTNHARINLADQQITEWLVQQNEHKQAEILIHSPFKSQNAVGE